MLFLDKLTDKEHLPPWQLQTFPLEPEAVYRTHVWLVLPLDEIIFRDDGNNDTDK